MANFIPVFSAYYYKINAEKIKECFFVHFLSIYYRKFDGHLEHNENSKVDYNLSVQYATLNLTNT